MGTENVDFTAILANMEAKRAALDAAIASLRAAIAAGALGPVGAGDFIGVPILGVGVTQNAEIPDGAFNGKTVSEAIKLYLSIVKKKQKTRQIVDALKRGGIESKSDSFGNIVYNNLDRMRSVTGEIAKVGKEWGLAEWYHPGIRSTPSSKHNPRTAHARKQKRAGAKDVVGLPSRIENLLASKPEGTYTPTEIATALGVKPIAVNVRLKRMVERGRIVKASPGHYRAGKTSVVKMPAAG
jgi:hypothetical protein